MSNQIIKTITQAFKPKGKRKPSDKYAVLALSGKAVMVHDGEQAIVLTTEAARKLARRLPVMAEKAEEYEG